MRGTKSASDMASAWKAEFNKRAFIGNGVGAGHAYEKWQEWEATASAEKTQKPDTLDGLKG